MRTRVPLLPTHLALGLVALSACTTTESSPSASGGTAVFDAGLPLPMRTGTWAAEPDAGQSPRPPIDAGALPDAWTRDAMTDAGADAPPPPSDLQMGEACDTDAQCASGVCFDLADERPDCRGAICSVACDTTTPCQQAAEAAGAPRPGGAYCNTDGVCNLVGTGLGAFVCN